MEKHEHFMLNLCLLSKFTLIPKFHMEAIWALFGSRFIVRNSGLFQTPGIAQHARRIGMLGGVERGCVGEVGGEWGKLD